MSVDAIKKFLDDVQNHPDNTMVNIGGTEVPLGSLRQLNASERTAIADRMKKIETDEADIKTRQAKIVDLAQKAQAAYNAAEEARAKAGAAPTKPADGNDPWADPWLAPVKGALDARDKAIEALKAELLSSKNSLAQAATIFAEDRWDREFQGLDFGKREKKPTRQELLDKATSEKLVDRHGFPSITKAWEEMSKGDRLDEIKKAEFERGVAEGKNAAMASRIPAPGVPGPGQGPAPLPKATSNGDLGDIYGEAMKDPELRAILEQAAGAGIV